MHIQTFALTQTIAAVGFPVIIFALIPIRVFLMPRYFRSEELGVLDEPTASAFTLESVGGSWGAYDKSPPDGSSTSTPAVTAAATAESSDTAESDGSDENAMERGDSIMIAGQKPSFSVGGRPEGGQEGIEEAEGWGSAGLGKRRGHH